MELPSDILLIDKPKGITSFDVIRLLRRKLSIRKMGHGGTLDPLATGLMIIGVGTGTKKLAAYLKLPKEYVAEIRVGERRSTGDMEGEVLDSMPVPALDTTDITSALARMVGVLTLPVSAYSAIKKDGVPMYKRARQAAQEGVQIEDVPMRDMEVLEAKYCCHACADDRCVIIVRFFVGSGTYIRSLAEELGRRLGYPATLQNLRRTKIGEFNVEDAEQMETNQ